MNKKLAFYIIFILLITLMLALVISGCNSRDNPSDQTEVSRGLSTDSVKSADSGYSTISTDIADSMLHPVTKAEHEKSTESAETKQSDNSMPNKNQETVEVKTPASVLKPSASPESTFNPTPSSSTKPSPTPLLKPTDIAIPTLSPEPVPTPTPTLIPCAASPAYRLEVDVTNQVVSAFEKDENGNYSRLVRQMICSTGKPSTPTPLGTYTLPGGKYDRGVWGYFSKFHVWARYFVRIKDGYLFHSVIYSKNDVNTLKQSTVDALGTPVSAGCIRLHVEDAKWIYDNAKAGTTVDVVKKEKMPELTAALKAGKPAPTQKPPEGVPVSIILDMQEKLELKVGQTAQFKAIVIYSDKTEKDETTNVEWSLDNEATAIIKDNTIRGVAPGEVVLTGKFKDITTSVTVCVIEAMPSEDITDPGEGFFVP